MRNSMRRSPVPAELRAIISRCTRPHSAPRRRRWRIGEEAVAGSFDACDPDARRFGIAEFHGGPHTQRRADPRSTRRTSCEIPDGASPL